MKGGFHHGNHTHHAAAHRPPIGEVVANPNYVDGILRSVFQMLLDILPTGQSINVAFLKVERPYTMIFSSAIVTVGITALGIVLFPKKDLK